MLWYLCLLILGSQMQCWAPPHTSLEECKTARESLAAQIQMEKTKKAQHPPIIGCFGTPQAFPSPKEESDA